MFKTFSMTWSRAISSEGLNVGEGTITEGDVETNEGIEGASMVDGLN
jgi:hypothetical protein